VGVRPRLPRRLRLFYRRHHFPVQVGALFAAVAIVVAFSHDTVEHPTRESAIAHLASSYESGRTPQLSKAEIAVLKARQPVPADRWVTEQTYDGTQVHRLPAPGAVSVVVGYSDAFFTVSDMRHLLGDEDAVTVAYRHRSIAAGRASQVTVLACCEGNDAPVRLVLRAAAPARVDSEWAEVSDLDLDLPDGRLAFGTEGGVGEIVDVPPGRYRMRVAGTGAMGDAEDRRERFRIELWPRRANAPLAVRRAAGRR